MFKLTMKEKKFLTSTFVIFLVSFGISFNFLTTSNSSIVHANGCSNETQTEDFLIVDDGIIYQYNMGNLILTNISNPAKPSQISQTDLNLPTSATNFYLEDKIAYFVTFDNELFVYNCENPNDVQKKYQYFFDGCIHDIVVIEDTIYVTQDKNVTIYNSLEYGFTKVAEVTIPCPYYLMYLAVHKGFAYAYYFQEDFAIINVTNPSNPTYNSTWTKNGIRQISHNDNLLFEVRFSSNFRITNISLPGEPEVIGYVNESTSLFSLKDIHYYKQNIYVLYTDGLQIYNATDLNNITEIVEYEIPKSEDQFFISLYVENNYAYINNFKENYLYIIDISDAANPHQVYPIIKPSLSESEIVLIIVSSAVFTTLIVVVAVNVIKNRKK